MSRRKGPFVPAGQIMAYGFHGEVRRACEERARAEADAAKAALHEAARKLGAEHGADHADGMISDPNAAAWCSARILWPRGEGYAQSYATAYIIAAREVDF